MFEDLLKQIKIGSATWKAFLLAGVLPSLVVVVGIEGYSRGWGGLRIALQKAFASWEDFTQSFPLAFLTAFLIAMTFYAGRHLILAFFQNLPRPVPIKLREWRLRSHRSEELNCRRKVQQALWRITVARWWERNFELGQFIHPLVREAALSRPPDRPELLQNCERARGIARDYNGTLSEMQGKNLLDALCSLHLLASDRGRVARRAEELWRRRGGAPGTPEEDWAMAEQQLGFEASEDWLEEELARWRDLVVQFPRAAGAFTELADSLQQEYARAYASQRAFPSSPWVQPTRIGNAFAALDDYSSTRYGIDTAMLWSRLQSVVPSVQREEVGTAQLGVETFLNLTVAMAFLVAFSLGSAFVAAVTKIVDLSSGRYHWSGWSKAWQFCEANWWIPVFVFACGALAAVSYSTAVYAAGFLRERIEAMVDLHILRWLRVMGFSPKSIGERMSLLERLGWFLGGGTQLPSDYPLLAATEPDPGETKKTEKE